MKHLSLHLQRTDLSCVNDYIYTITCEWNSTAWLTSRNCTLHSIRDTFQGKKEKICSLNTTRSCSVTLSNIISFTTEIELYVLCNQTWMDGVKSYRPSQHVKLRPPGKLKINRTLLMWSLEANFPEFIKNYLFELQVKDKQQSWEEVKPIQVYGMSMSVANSSMCARECEARIRIKPLETKSTDQIRGIWSDWSSVVTWKTSISNTINFSQPEVTGIMVGFAVLVLILLILTPLSIYRHKCGLKMGCEHIPDPSTYFQPLIIEHKGNFQAWLGSQHSTSLFLPSQSFNCEISPIDEVSEAWGSPLTASTLFLYTNQTATLQQQMMDTSQLSSGVSNMGYFYSEHQPGSVCVDSCPVYFSYHPEGGSLQTSMSYERLQGTEPTSPDSGFGMEAEKEEDDYEEDDEDATTGNGANECSGINMQHLVSFVLSMPESSRVTVPPCFAQLTPWHEEAESPGTSVNSESQDSPAVRPSSMVVQPCNSGYLTLKEMQKYSNKSI
ncbi:interleukin-2 receptor subunit beta isoform X2 [Silurus meridionalis]|uniref:interleukin-2 receptor subunit beta isoform X2 n=1 Tax=Silurus meridionalis TaxID=175797 RepID=UPI001EEAF2A3|nr:interleukin-2 receptor subunit beta isoform X2 [Silurus meridionalis]